MVDKNYTMHKITQQFIHNFRQILLGVFGIPQTKDTKNFLMNSIKMKVPYYCK
jgi:hypothetical protein